MPGEVTSQKSVVAAWSQVLKRGGRGRKIGGSSIAGHEGPVGYVESNSSRTIIPGASQVGGENQTIAVRFHFSDKRVETAGVCCWRRVAHGKVRRVGESGDPDRAETVRGNCGSRICPIPTQPCGVPQGVPRRIQNRHEGIVVVAFGCLCRACGDREIGRKGSAGHIGVSGGVQRDGISQIFAFPPEVCHIVPRRSGGIEARHECIVSASARGLVPVLRSHAVGVSASGNACAPLSAHGQAGG